MQTALVLQWKKTSVFRNEKTMRVGMLAVPSAFYNPLKPKVVELVHTACFQTLLSRSCEELVMISIS